MLKFRLLLLLSNFIFLMIVCECVRRRRLSEKYAILWLIVGGIISIFSIFPYALMKISNAMGIFYLSTVLLICFFFLVIIVFSYAIAISDIMERNKTLSQEIAILKSDFEKLGEHINNKKTELANCQTPA